MLADSQEPRQGADAPPILHGSLLANARMQPTSVRAGLQVQVLEMPGDLPGHLV